MNLFTLVFLAFVGASLGAPHISPNVFTSNPWEIFQYAADLDVAGKYWMFWTPDDEAQIITFEVHVEALGYVGFGISPNGAMTGSDVVIGWVLDDGTAVFHDRHALGQFEPVIDASQDVTLLAAAQNDTHTILRFSRPYITCDTDDRDITADTLRVVYSFTDTDPEDITGLSHHGFSNRGTKSIILLSFNEGEQSLPDDSVSMDVVVSEMTIPRKRTTYWCEFREIPQREQKHQVIMFEPVLTPGNEGLVHHILVYACYGPVPDGSDGVAWDCIDNNMPGAQYCSTGAFVWAVGGSPFYFPSHTGLPLFDPEEYTPLYFMIEIHYDNPSFVEGVTDQSGIRLHMTQTMRQYDIGMLVTGSDVTEEMLLPPHYDALTYRGFCPGECFSLGLNTTDDIEENDYMTVFAVYQHSHLMGRRMRTRLYRDGVEQEPLMIDNNYDFNFQETRKLKEERRILPNDVLVTDCVYDSTDRDDITIGGRPTLDEMCLSFLYYYPAQKIVNCISIPPLHQSIQMIEGVETEPSPYFPFFRITAPPQYVDWRTEDVLASLDWRNETIRNRYQEVVLEQNTDLALRCANKATPLELALPKHQTVPELGDDWVDPDEGPCVDRK